MYDRGLIYYNYIFIIDMCLSGVRANDGLSGPHIVSTTDRILASHIGLIASFNLLTSELSAVCFIFPFIAGPQGLNGMRWESKEVIFDILFQY